MNSAARLKGAVAMAVLAALPAVASAAPSVHNRDVIVRIGSTATFASGTIADAATRGSGIGCYAIEETASSIIWCNAYSGQGNSRQSTACEVDRSQVARWLPVVALINESSYLSFRTDANQRCTSLSVSNGSRYLN